MGTRTSRRRLIPQMTRPFSIALLAILAVACSETEVKTPDLGNELTGSPEYPIRLADKKEVRKHHRLYESTDTFYEKVLVPADFNGGIIVAKNGIILYERYRGLERLDRSDSMDASSPLHIASTSKTFTSMAVLKLQEEGLIDISDRVDSILPGFPFPGVTVKDLLNHRSGLPNYVHFMESLGWKKDSLLTNSSLLRFMADNRKVLLVNPPGRNFSYSNTNYAILALVIEKVSGKTYAQYLNDTFFRPLGMKDTYVFGTDKKDYAIPSYDQKDRMEPFGFLDAVYGDKNVYSTPRDLLRWDRALYPGRMFSQSVLDSAFKGYSYEKPGIRNYGLGWRLLEPENGKKVVFHNGWWHGNNSVFWRLTSDSATIIVLGNRFSRRIYDAVRISDALEGYREANESEE
jgi:CubicO group peptidase (beta-lactamase class C family)